MHRRLSCALIVGTYAAFGDVVGVVHDVSGQAKVADLDQFTLTDQHIPGSQIPVDALREKIPSANFVCLTSVKN